MRRKTSIVVGAAVILVVVSFLVLTSSAGGVMRDIATVYFCLFLIVLPIALIWALVRNWRRASDAVEPRTAEESEAEIEPNMGGIALSIVAATLAVVSVFLPALESSSFARIEKNTLIQSGLGFVILGCAVGIIGGAYRVYSKRTMTWSVFVLGVAILGTAIYSGTGSRAELHSVVSITGESLSVKGSPAVGLYAAGAAGLLAMFGGLILAGRTISSFDAGPRSTTKTCPDCAETVLEAARVCKHCGHQFSPMPS